MIKDYTFRTIIKKHIIIVDNTSMQIECEAMVLAASSKQNAAQWLNQAWQTSNNRWSFGKVK